MKKVAVIGVVGVPANYGGFETLVENIIGDNTSDDVEYTVFCSSRMYQKRLDTYKGARLEYIGIRANGMQSMLYDFLAMTRTSNRFDAALVLGLSGCIFLPLFRLWFKNKIIVNIDGLEHQRDKWSRFAKWFLRKSEAMALKCADVVVADNMGIQDYVTETYHKPSTLIAYGGDHVERNVSDKKTQEILRQYGVEKGEYAVSICRIEPENNCHIILDAFANSNKKLVYIGNWDRTEYGRELKNKYERYENINIHASEYDLDTLYVIRLNARLYIHGHSAGGTNPSLVEAMFFGIPILAFDVIYNRATTYNQAYYFKNSEELRALIERRDLEGGIMKIVAKNQYIWKRIASQYESLF